MRVLLSLALLAASAQPAWAGVAHVQAGRTGAPVTPASLAVSPASLGAALGLPTFPAPAGLTEAVFPALTGPAAELSGEGRGTVSFQALAPLYRAPQFQELPRPDFFGERGSVDVDPHLAPTEQVPSGEGSAALTSEDVGAAMGFPLQRTLGAARQAVADLPDLGAASASRAYGVGTAIEAALSGEGRTAFASDNDAPMAIAITGNTGALPDPVPGSTAPNPSTLTPPEARRGDVPAAAPAPALGSAPNASIWTWVLQPYRAVRIMLAGDAEVSPLVRQHRRDLRWAQVLMIADVAIATAIIYGVGWAIDLAVGGVVSGTQGLLVLLTGLLVAANVFYGGLERFHVWLKGRLSAKVLRDFRNLLFHHVLSFAMPFFRRGRAQEIAPRFTDDVYRLAEKNVYTPVVVPHYIVYLLVSAAMLLLVHYWLGLMLLATVPLFALLSAWFGNKLEAISETYYDQRAEMVARATDIISGIETIKMFGAELEAEIYFSRANDALAETAMKEAKIEANYHALLSSMGDFVTKVFIVLMAAWALFLYDAPSVGTITAMQGYALGIKYAVEGLSERWTKTKEAQGATKRILGLLGHPAEPGREAGLPELGPVEGTVRFENVHFRYTEKTPILNGLSFEVKPGQVAAFVGETGSGKSTVLRLLARLYDPRQGSVTVDGVDIKSVHKDSLTRQLAVVPQDAFLFNGTIRENLLAVMPGAADAQLEKALRDAHAGFVFEPTVLPQGLDTDVGDRGSKLSGGQRQRVAIARAILRNPRILLLDEATSALDNESEQIVQDALDRLMEGRTTFVVAHRLDTIREADVIFFLDKGRVAESGTYEELMAKKGRFYRMATRRESQRRRRRGPPPPKG